MSVRAHTAWATALCAALRDQLPWITARSGDGVRARWVARPAGARAAARLTNCGALPRALDERPRHARGEVDELVRSRARARDEHAVRPAVLLHEWRDRRAGEGAERRAQDLAARAEDGERIARERVGRLGAPDGRGLHATAGRANGLVCRSDHHQRGLARARLLQDEDGRAVRLAGRVSLLQHGACATSELLDARLLCLGGEGLQPLQPRAPQRAMLQQPERLEHIVDGASQVDGAGARARQCA
eukprot:3706443-Prymnesium_polylepis.1